MACIPSGLTNLVDFQGHVLDNSFFGLSASNPVIGQVFLGNDTSQQWAFVTHTVTPTFLIVNGDNEAAAFLSYAGSGVPSGLRQFAQAAIQTTEPQAVAFIATCTSANTAIITDTVFGLALTAWPVVSTSTTTPVTYEAVDGRPGQTWKLERLD